MQQFTDSIGNLITLQSPPQRIVSLVPSLSQLLHYLELNQEVVGITKFCIHPADWFQSKTRIGGTKNINIEKVAQLEPDLVFASKEENVKEQIESLQKICPVYVTDVVDIKTALHIITQIGKITATQTKATHLQNNIIQQLENYTINKTYSTLYLIWNNPYMSIGGDTYIHDTLSTLGFHNILAQSKRYPQLTDEQIVTLQPQVIMLSSEPYPFKENHVAALQSLVPTAKVILVDGEIFSWYGSAMLQLAEYGNILHQQLG